MRKQVALMLMLILGLAIPHVVTAASTPVDDPFVQKPALPQDIALQNPVDPDPQDPGDQELPCGGQADIVIDANNPFAPTTLQNIITDYRNHPDLGVSTLNTLRDRYELCFDIQNGHVKMESALAIAQNGSEAKGLAIYALKVMPHEDLSAGDPVVQVDFSIAPVSLIELSMIDVLDGLRVIGSQVQLSGADIAGDSGGGGSCIELNGANNSIIKSSAISNCDIGVLIDGANDVLIGAAIKEDFYELDGITLKDANSITKNGYGIHLLNGNRILFPYNSFFDNDLFGSMNSHAIVIEPGQNENIETPQVVPDEGGGNFTCRWDQNGILESRVIRFTVANSTIPIYKAGSEMKQPLTHLMTCLTDADGICDAINIEGLSIPQNACGVPSDPSDPNYSDEYLVALKTSNSTSSTSDAFFPGGIVMPAASGEGAVIPTADADDDAVEEVTLTSGATGELVGGEAVGMKAAAPCSLLRNDTGTTIAPSLGAWWIIFSIAFLASMRVARVRNGRRRK